MYFKSSCCTPKIEIIFCVSCNSLKLEQKEMRKHGIQKTDKIARMSINVISIKTVTV